MKVIKSAQATLANSDSIGASTSRYTKPLVLKIVAAFAVMVGLLVAMTLFALFNLNQGRANTDKALEGQVNANYLQRLRQAVVSERVSLVNSLYTGLADPDLSAYQAAFDDAEHNLLERSQETYSISSVHSQLKELYRAVITANTDGNAAQARALWQIADVQAGKLVNLLDVRLDTATSQAIASTRDADQVANNAAGSTLWLAFLAFFIIGGLVYFVFARVLGPLRLLNQNLTQLLWTQTEHLTDQLNVLQAEVNVNNDMMTTVRHDLKSPLSSIKGLAELSTILQPNLTQDVRENLDKIVEMADTSVSTISDVLTRREQRLDLQTIEVDRLVDKVLQLVDLRYYNVQRKVEATTWVLDPGLMEHALLNLISNARKFSTQGIGVGVRKVRKPGTVDTSELELWVWNDGAVINAEDRGDIFKPGKQTSEGKKAGGHGLGLYIVKTLAERHHGRVTVESHEKVGTTFRIFIPLMLIESNDNEPFPDPVLTDEPQALAELLNATTTN